ncbi:MAG: glycosyltransferase, partial [Acidobacteriota bacterium]
MVDSAPRQSLRVAHCIHGLGLGGAQKVIAALVRGRQDPRLEVFVYSCHGGVHREEIAAAGATVRLLPRHLPKIDPLWAMRLGRRMRRDRIDLVHTHLFGDSLHGVLAARLAGRL